MNSLISFSKNYLSQPVWVAKHFSFDTLSNFVFVYFIVSFFIAEEEIILVHGAA